jgi:hypothetical protein
LITDQSTHALAMVLPTTNDYYALNRLCTYVHVYVYVHMYKCTHEAFGSMSVIIIMSFALKVTVS